MTAIKTMRITGGSLVRRRFRIPDLVNENVVRPTPDRVREAIFSIIKAYLPNAQVLDIFAGSGSHGFESISRGALQVTFVEQNPDIAAVIKENIKSLGLSEQCKIILKDARLFIAEQPLFKADVIFVDPPYSLVLDEEFFNKLALHLAHDGMAIFRCFKKEHLHLGKKWIIERDRSYGGTRVLNLSLRPLEPEPARPS